MSAYLSREGISARAALRGDGGSAPPAAEVIYAGLTFKQRLSPRETTTKHSPDWLCASGEGNPE
jgi:hypothetical protein